MVSDLATVGKGEKVAYKRESIAALTADECNQEKAMGNVVEEWYRSIPPITKVLFTSTVLATVCTGILVLCSPLLLLFKLDGIIYSFEIWRIFTNVIYLGPFNFAWPFYVYFLYKYSELLEKGWFDGRPADYLFLIGYGFTILNILAALLELQITSKAFIFMLVYVFCRHNPNMIIPMTFGIKVRAFYMPWAWAGLHLIMGQSIFLDVTGILVGHLYFVLTHHYNMLNTPRWLIGLYPNTFVGTGTTGSAPAWGRTPAAGNQQAPQSSGSSGGGYLSSFKSAPSQHKWGQGRVLGSSNS